MKKSLRPLLIGLGIVILVPLALVAEVARRAGTFQSFDTGFAGSCTAVALGGSSEDLQVNHARGVAYLSILERAGLHASNPATGSIMLLDLNLAEPAPRAALAHDPPNFRPHGLSLYLRADEPARLFAISHWPDGTHSVEIAEQSGAAFVPKETLRDAAFRHPNALVAVAPRQFYLVNDTAAEGAWPLLREVLGGGSGSLVYFDGERASVVEEDLAYPAGIAVSPEGTRLYVGEALGKRLRIYKREPANGVLTLEEVVPLGTAPDNINVDADGVVWIAAHPKLFAFASHARDTAKPAPTQVLRFDPRAAGPAGGPNDARLAQVYGNQGTEISAGTVAAHWRGAVLVGALFDQKVLICKPSP